MKKSIVSRVLLLFLFYFTLNFPLYAGGGGGGGGGTTTPAITVNGYIYNGNVILCTGEQITLTLVTELPDPTNIEWQFHTEGFGGDFQKVNNSDGKMSITTFSTTPSKHNLLCRVRYKSGGKEYYTSNAKIFYNQNISTGGTISSDQSIVSTSIPARLNGVTEGTITKGELQYSWQKSIDNASWQTIGGAREDRYSPPQQNATTYYRRIAHNQYGFCFAASNPITIELLQATVNGSEGEFCANTRSNSLSVTTKGSKPAEIQWQKNRNNIGWEDVAGATGTIYTPIELNDGVYKYRAKVSWISGTQIMNTAEKIFKWFPSLQGGVISPENQVIVEDSRPEELKGTSPSGGKSSYTYQWRQRNSSSLWVDIGGATGPNYQAGVNQPGTYHRVVASDIPNCLSISNSAVIKTERLNPGTIGHNATIGKHGRHRPLVSTSPASTSPTSVIEFKWEKQTNTDGFGYSGWYEVQGWSTTEGYSPPVPLTDSLTQYRRLARVGSGAEQSSNNVTIILSPVDPGVIFIDPSRTNLVQYDVLGMIQDDNTFPTTFGVNKRFKWQIKYPGLDDIWNDLSDWGDSTTHTTYNYNIAFSTEGVYSYRRLFVQDDSNKDDPNKVFESNEESVYVTALHGGKIGISDTIVMRDAVPSPLTSVENGNGQYYQWQWRNPDNVADLAWIDIGTWSQNNAEYTPTDGMTIPKKQYRRLCKTLETTDNAVAKSSNIITVYAQAVLPGVITLSPDTVVIGATVNLISVDQGTGSVFKWQVKRGAEDSPWENVDTDIFSADKIGSLDNNVRFNSTYRRLSKLSVGDGDIWIAYSNEITVITKPLHGGTISRDQDIVKHGLPSKFNNVESGNGEVYAWYRKKEGDATFSPVTEFSNNLEYQEETPVEVTTYYRRLVKPLRTSSINDTIGSNTVVVVPTFDLETGSIAISSTGIRDTSVTISSTLEEFHSISTGNGKVFKWQKQSEGESWTDVTTWGNYLTYQESLPIIETIFYRRCTKAAVTNLDNLMKCSTEIRISVSLTNGGQIAGDTTLNVGDIPNKFINIRAGDNDLYKWQKKIGAASWLDVTEWSSDNLEYQETMPISATTYYRRLNKMEGIGDDQAASSNIIAITTEELTTRDETVTADNFYLTSNEVVFGLPDDMLITRARAQAKNNQTQIFVDIITPVTHNIESVPGAYRATFSTAKGESKTVKVYVVEDVEPIDGILLFAQDFTLYTSELGEPISDVQLISRAEARGYDLNTQKPVNVSVRDRSQLDAALDNILNITSGSYPVFFGFLNAEISANVYIAESQLLQVSFDVNFDDVNDENQIEPIELETGKPYGELPLATRNGAEFVNWSLDVYDLNPIESTDIVGVFPNTDTDHELYAIWKYPVTLDLNYDVAEDNQSTILVQQYRPYQYFQPLPIPQRRGYIFLGWSLDIEGFLMIDGTAEVLEQNEHTLYANWKAREIMVLFNASGGTVSPDKKAVIFNEAYGELPKPEKGYYKFKVWCMADGREVLAAHIVDTVAVEITLYAKYETYTQSGNDLYVITPNGDGLNDRFYLQFLWYGKEDIVKDVVVYIYNRQGNIVYNQKNYQALDGDFDGGNLSDGTYIVAIHYTENGEKNVYHATISILR